MWQRRCTLTVACAFLALSDSTPAQAQFLNDAADDPPPVAYSRPVLPVLQRVVREFRFEEAETVAIEMPIGFFRLLTIEGKDLAPPCPDGFPPYGKMRLANNHARSGNWSFQFELQAGSMAARTALGMCPIMPNADYEVSLWTRTENLHHARVRLASWLHDTHGNPILESRAISEPVLSNQHWTQLRVIVPGNFNQAADLIVELQLLQPGQLSPSLASASGVPLNDVRGQVWFDDLLIRNAPRMTLKSVAPDHIFIHPVAPLIVFSVHDIARVPLHAELRVFNLQNELVAHHAAPLPPGDASISLPISISQFGWYRADLHVIEHDHSIASRSISFMYLPTSFASTVQNDRFGIALPAMSLTAMAYTLNVLPPLSVRHVSLPILHQDLDASNMTQWISQLRQATDALSTKQHTITLAIDGIPRHIAQEVHLEPSQSASLLTLDDQKRPTELSDQLTLYGLQIERWRVGSLDEDAARASDRSPAAISKMLSALQRHIMSPVLVLPVRADDAATTVDTRCARSILAPPAIGPDVLGSHVDAWRNAGDNYDVHLQMLDSASYSASQRVIDLAQRALHAWRAGATVISIDAPWNDDHTTQTINIQPEFATWAVLAKQLHGRTFVGELQLDDTSHIWILRGNNETSSALVVWTTRVDPAAGTRLALQLSSGSVSRCDLQGNTRTLPLIDDLHHLTLEALPAFITDIDADLALFRAGIAIEPHAIPSETREIDAAITIRNPWKKAISGSIRMEDVTGLAIHPRHQPFSISAGAQSRLPISVTLDRSTPAGRTHIDCVIKIDGPTPYTFRSRLPIEIQLDAFVCSATWRVEHNPQTGAPDLLVTVHATNTSNAPVNLDAIVRAPGISIKRPLASRLEPGQSVTRPVRIENGAALLSEQSLLVGIADREGVARYNMTLEIPALNPPPALAEAQTNIRR